MQQVPSGPLDSSLRQFIKRGHFHRVRQAGTADCSAQVHGAIAACHTDNAKCTESTIGTNPIDLI